jgi:AcrR family transcriptional regulator
MSEKAVTRRQAQAVETANRIYAAAIELMDRKGFERLTIADISKRAGVSVGAFYHHFRSKDDILVEIFRRADEYFLTRVVADLEQRGIPERIVAYFDHYARFNVASGVELTRRLFNPKVKLFAQTGRPMQTILQDLIREGQDRNEIRREVASEQLARMLFVMARGVVFDWSVYDGDYDLEATMHNYMGALVSTLRPGNPAHG